MGNVSLKVLKSPWIFCSKTGTNPVLTQWRLKTGKPDTKTFTWLCQTFWKMQWLADKQFSLTLVTKPAPWTELNFWFGLSTKKCQISCSYWCSRIWVAPPLDCLTVFVELPIRVNRNSKLISSNLSSPLGTRSKDISSALQMLLTKREEATIM